MGLLLNGPTGLKALRYLRCHRKPWISNAKPITPRLTTPDEKTLNHARSIFCDSGETLFVSVANAADRRRIAGTACSVCSRTLPARSLISFDDQLWLPSPESLFLQMHGHLTGLECIALGFELCGHYCPRGTEAYEYDLPPVTSPDKLRRYLNRSAGLRHCDRARRALRFVRPSSASLRETQLALLLSLPFRYGGYAFSDPVLNRPIDVSPISGSKWSRDARRTDISWEGEPVAVEYDSNEFHSGREKIERDAKRRTLLQAAGFHVVVVTNDQLKKIAEMDRVERTLNHLMSARRRNRIADYELRKRRLHQAILRLDT